MRAILLAAGLCVFAAPAITMAPAAASDKTDVLAVVHQYMDGYNKGDVKAEVATCASPASIIDDFPPHHWQGATACADWAKAYTGYGKANGIAGGHVALAAPSHVTVDGNSAYAIFPANYTFTQKGKPQSVPHSVWTVALAKQVAGWRIVGWTWSDGP